MNDHVAEPFRSILNSFAEPKPHLQGQKVVRRRDLDRYKALSAVHAELELAGVTIDIGQLDWAVSEVTNRLHEASLDRQFAEEQNRKGKAKDADEFEKTSPKPDTYPLGTKCWECGHARGEHDEKECRGGEDIPCRCDSFVEPEEPDYPGLGKNVLDTPEPTGQDFDDEEEAEREERRQYRAWRNDSGV